MAEIPKIENTTAPPAETAPVEKTDGRPRRPSLRETLNEAKVQNMLLGASVIQLLLALLMYMLPSVRTSLLLGEAAAGIVLALAVRYAPMEKRAVRVLVRVVVIAVLALTTILTIVVVLMTNASRQPTDTEATSIMLTTSNYFMLAAVALPPCFSCSRPSR